MRITLSQKTAIINAHLEQIRPRTAAVIHALASRGWLNRGYTRFRLFGPDFESCDLLGAVLLSYVGKRHITDLQLRTATAFLAIPLDKRFEMGLPDLLTVTEARSLQDLNDDYGKLFPHADIKAALLTLLESRAALLPTTP